MDEVKFKRIQKLTDQLKAINDKIECRRYHRLNASKIRPLLAERGNILKQLWPLISDDNVKLMSNYRRNDE